MTKLHRLSLPLMLLLAFTLFSCKSTPKPEEKLPETEIEEPTDTENQQEEDLSETDIENQDSDFNTETEDSEDTDIDYSHSDSEDYEEDSEEEENQDEIVDSDYSDSDDVEFLEDDDSPKVSRRLLDKGQLTATQLAEYFLSQRPDYDLIEIIHFAQYYIVEAAAENINSDVAFAQMCLETGYLRFGGLVQPEWHNYCGLGAMDAEHPGCIFETEQMGVRAHIQHLQAYATTEDVKLNNDLIDPRYSWVHKTKYIETINGLTGTWATDPMYSIKIEGILNRMEQLLLN